MQRLCSTRIFGPAVSTFRTGNWYGEAGDEHLVAIRQGLELAVAAFLAGRAHVVAFDEEHLDQGFPHVLEVGGLVLDGPCPSATGWVQAAM